MIMLSICNTGIILIPSPVGENGSSPFEVNKQQLLAGGQMAVTTQSIHPIWVFRPQVWNVEPRHCFTADL